MIASIDRGEVEGNCGQVRVEQSGGREGIEHRDRFQVTMAALADIGPPEFSLPLRMEIPKPLVLALAAGGTG